MKKSILISVLSLVLTIAWGGQALAQAQKEMTLTATNYSGGPGSTPGLYVSGWPAFTLSYPKDWQVQNPLPPLEVFRVAVPRPALPPSPVLAVSVFPSPLPLDKLTSLVVPVLERRGKDIKIVYDKPSQLKDGTPTQEAEFEWLLSNWPKPKLNTLFLATRKDDVWIMVNISDDKGKIGEDLKSIAYSLKLQPGKQELVKVPHDAEQFLKQFSSDVGSHDVEEIMTHYSDRYFNNGRNKQGAAEAWRQVLRGIAPNITFYGVSVTGFELQGDKAYVTGFFTDNNGKHPIGSPGVMIKEDGHWKWYGNQK